MHDLLGLVKDLCKQSDITVTELERKLGFSSSTILKWDRSRPLVDKVKAVADYFDVSVDYLLGRTGYQSTVDKTLLHDREIYTIHRLRSNLSPKNREKMMALLRLQFEEDFPEED
jgi:transcriptional regulator with XRE-family HTH domain